MLHITPEAGLTIQKLAHAKGVTTTGGLRIETREGAPDFVLSVAATPAETDMVITEETTGARVMVDSLAADQLADKSLDVADTVESTARFQLTNQGVSTAD